MAGESAADEEKSADLDFRNIFGALPDAYAVVRIDSNSIQIVEFSEGFVDLFDLASAAAPLQLEDVLTPAAAAILAEASRRALDETGYAQTAVSIRSNGSTVWRNAKVRVLSKDPQPSVLLSIGEYDRQRDPRGGASLDQLEAVNDAVVFIFDVESGRTHYVSSRIEGLLGRPAGAVRLDQIRALVHAADLPTIRKKLIQLGSLAHGEVQKLSFRIRGADQGWKWMDARLRVLSRDAAGKVRRVIGVATDVTERHELKMALQEASDAIALAGETERRRIARELHDSTVQHLVILDWGLSELHRRAAEGAGLRDELFDELRAALDAAQREIRLFAYMLHPPRLDERGFVDTLRTFVHGVGRRAEIPIELLVAGEAVEMPGAVELSLFRVAQEALMNIHRHAMAEKATVRVLFAEDAVTLEVEDDGVGLAGAARAASSEQSEHDVGVGIAGMRARMAQLGGALEILSSSAGCLVRARAPIAAMSEFD